jgi:hypothetical protein
MLSRIAILFILASCSLFKGSEKIKSNDLIRNLDSIKVEGEGKGRLHIQERQYLFGVESLLRADKSWIMGVSIPLHGEEVLLFPALNEMNYDDLFLDSFALRIDAGIRENLKKSNLRGLDFLNAMRKTLRFLLSSKLKLPVSCQTWDKKQVCSMGEDEFFVISEDKSIRIITPFAGHQLITTASNLTGPFFMNTQFKVHNPERKQDLLKLELFWK